jgi:hypothetical protein
MGRSHRRLGALAYAPAPAGPAPVGWRENRDFGSATNRKASTAAPGFDKGTLAMAHIGLTGAGEKPTRSAQQAYGPPPLVKSRHSVRTAASAPRSCGIAPLTLKRQT